MPTITASWEEIQQLRLEVSRQRVELAQLRRGSCLCNKAIRELNGSRLEGARNLSPMRMRLSAFSGASVRRERQFTRDEKNMYRMPCPAWDWYLSLAVRRFSSATYQPTT